MEIKVSEIQSLTPVLITNYEELKKELTEKTDLYKNIVYSEENIKDAKTDRANLNKLEKAINDEKIRIKNVFLKPYEDFESKCKELMALVKEASTNIDKQIKDFESKQDDEKKTMIKDIFDGYVGEFKELINFDVVFDPKWLNKTCSYKKIEEDINHIITKTKLDMETINGQISDDNIRKQVIGFYFRNINNPSILSLALQEGKSIEETSKQISNLETTSNTIQPTSEEIKEDDKKYLAIIDFRAFIETKEQYDNLKQCIKENGIVIKKI